MSGKKRGGRSKYLLLIDTGIYILVAVAVFLLAGFSKASLWDEGWMFAETVVITFCFTMAARLISRTYGIVWRYSDSATYLRIVLSDMIGGGIAVLVIHFLPLYVSAWLNILVVALADIATLSSRFCYRIIYKHVKSDSAVEGIPVAIIGAGQVGAMLFDELRINKQLNRRPVFFVDRDRNKIGNTVKGLRVYRESEALEEVFETYGVREALIALPEPDSETVRALFNLYSSFGCRVKLCGAGTVEGSSGEIRPVLHDVKLGDLLPRGRVRLDRELLRTTYGGKSVLIVGGGSRIGHELCTAVAELAPSSITVVDISGDSLVTLRSELLAIRGNRNVRLSLADPADAGAIDAAIKSAGADVVIYAATLRVPSLVANGPAANAKRELTSLVNTASAAEGRGVGRFIFVSSDPLDGDDISATDKLCEGALLSRTDGNTCFAAVRCDRALTCGEGDPILRLFRAQIERGGPITLTDRAAEHRFTSPGETARLILQAGASAGDGGLILVRPGRIVRLSELAENMIKLAGLRPYKDIAIEEIGARPGEKVLADEAAQASRKKRGCAPIEPIDVDRPSRQEAEKRLADALEALSRGIAPSKLVRAAQTDGQ